MPGPFGFTNAFTSGELDDNCYDRTDLQQVAKGCAQAQNLMIQIAGPLAKRYGFWLVGATEGGGVATRILAFRKSWADSCLLEFSNEACRVWNIDGTPFVDTSTGAQLSFTTPFTAAQLPLLRWKQVQDVIYFRTSDGMVPQTLSRTNYGVTAADWIFDVTTYVNGPWLAENGELTDQVTLYNQGTPADIMDGNDTTGSGVIPVSAKVKIESNFNLFDPSLEGSQMRIRANLTSLSCYAWAPAFPYFTGDFATSNGNMYYCPGIAAPGTAVHSGNNPPVQLQGSQSDGTIIWWFLHDGAGIVTLDTYVSPTEMMGTVYHAVPVPSNQPTSYFAFAAYSPADGWPTAWPEIREERFVDGATSGNWDWVDLTQTAGFNPTQEDFTPGTGLGVIDDDNGVRRRVGTKGGKIQWFRTSTYLLVGTETGESLISGPVLDEPISPNGVVIKDLSAFGCAPVEPENVQSGLMFVTITGRTLREIVISTNQEPGGEDHSFLAQHIATRQFAQLKWTKAPLNNLWCRLGDGGLACYTYHVEQQVKGFTSQALGGATGAVIDMQVLPSPNGYEALWVVVEGPMGTVILRQSDPTENLYMDVATSWSGAATNAIPAPALLNGDAVDVLLGSGDWYRGLTVAGGQVLLPAGVTATSAQIGFTYPVAFTSLKLDLKNLWGGALLQTQRITEALIDLLCTLCTISGDNPNWPGEDVSSRLATDVPGIVPRRFVKRVTIVQDESAETDDHDPRISITEQSPYPFTLYAIRQDKVAIGE
jgi:hypothetical protein